MKQSQPSPSVSLDQSLSRHWLCYQENFARYLLLVAREYKSAVMAQLKASPDYHMLRLSFESVVTTLHVGPLRPKEIATRLGLSKQHASQLIAAVQRAGLVEKLSDPNDQRARLVVLTPLGQRLLVDGVRAATVVSEQFAAAVGAEAMDNALRQTARLANTMMSESDSVAPMVSHGIIGEPLMRLADHVQHSLIGLCRQRGFDDLRPSHGQVLIYMSPAGARLQELARLNEVSTQGIGRIVRELEQRGYVQRRPDQGDARGRRIWLSERGEQLLKASVASIDILQAQLVALIGEAEFTSWWQALRAIHVEFASGRMWPDGAVCCDALSAGRMADDSSTCRATEADIEHLLQWIAQRLGAESEPLPVPLQAMLGEELVGDLERVLALLASRLGAG